MATTDGTVKVTIRVPWKFKARFVAMLWVMRLYSRVAKLTDDERDAMAEEVGNHVRRLAEKDIRAECH